MMELALVKSLMDKDFYTKHKGIRCPDKLFSKDVRKIKQTLDYAMREYGNSLTGSELEALFFATNNSMTTANKDVYKGLFRMLNKEQPMSQPIAEEVMSKLFQQVVGEEVANLGFEYVNGSQTSLEPLRNILSNYQDDFLPNLNVEWEDLSMEALLAAADEESQWKFNIPSLRRKIEGISAGHMVIVGARPNTGKTSFHASIVAAEGGFASQGAKCVIFCNEEAATRVGARYLSAGSGMSIEEVRKNQALAGLRWSKVNPNVKILDSVGKDLTYVEAILKREMPDIVILDMGDKFANKTSDKSDVYLKEAAIHARNIAKQYKCAIIWMSQLSAVAEGKVHVDQSMLEGSKTGKAAEADLMILISKNATVEGQEEADTQRHLNIAKNKLTGGWHGLIHCDLDGARSIYSA